MYIYIYIYMRISVYAHVLQGKCRLQLAGAQMPQNGLTPPTIPNAGPSVLNKAKHPGRH